MCNGRSASVAQARANLKLVGLIKLIIANFIFLQNLDIFKTEYNSNSFSYEFSDFMFFFYKNPKKRICKSFKMVYYSEKKYKY